MPIFKRRSISSLGAKKKEMPEGLWHNCPECKAIIHEVDMKQRFRVCPKCDYHFTMTSGERIEMLVDPGSFVEIDARLESVDALGFTKYTDKIKSYQQQSGLRDAIVCGKATISDMPVVIGVMDFRFLGASMGSVVGVKVTRAIELATAEKRGVILVCASGGARMHEGILSLMQMAKTSGALALHAEAKLPYLAVLTHPTTGGVTASFATLGDVIIAEPGALVGFAGARVIKDTTKQTLPPGFQTAEFLLKHGLIDQIVPRPEMRERLHDLLCALFLRRKAGAPVAASA